jgi:DNA-binding NarL/FixJ family response regulator
MTPTSTLEAGTPATTVAPVRIVIVDDHKLLRDGLRALLAPEAATIQLVGEAGTARDAYAVVKKTRPDLVILDLNLPDQNGARLTAEIRSAWPKIKVLVLSGSGDTEAAAAVAHSGADGFVRKEDAVEDLLRAIPIIMQGRSFFSPAAADAVARALWNKAEVPAPATAPRLAEREREVLRGFAEGMSYKEIAAQMGISVRTAETYRARLVQKLGCNSRAELVRCAIRHGLVEA